MHRLDPALGIMKLWAQIRKRGNPDVESLQGGEGRVGQQQLWGGKPNKSKPYEQGSIPGGLLSSM